jgi:hypothetical protein
LTNNTSGSDASTNGQILLSSGNDIKLLNREAGNVLFGTSGTDQMTINSSGNVGVGVTPKTWHSSEKVLQWGPRNSLMSDSANMFLQNNLYDDSGGNVKYIATGYAGKYVMTSGEHQWFSAPSGTADAAITPTRRMTLTEPGNLDIGGASHAARRFSIKGAASDNSENTIEVFNSSSTTIFKLQSDGIRTMPLQPCFCAHPSSILNDMFHNSWDTITWATERIDRNSDFSSTTFTAPASGAYQLNVCVYLQGGIDQSAGYYQARLVTSNKTYHIDIFSSNVQLDDADASYYQWGASVVADMDASDTATVSMIQSGGTTMTDVNTNSFFSGFLI